jgi:signal peptidase
MFNKLIDTAGIATGIALVLLVLAVKGPVAAGNDSFIVIGGSMEPAIHLGSAVVVQPAKAAQLDSGDVITYIDRTNIPVTHRIIEVIKDQSGLGFRTQGDANRTPDAEIVRPANVLGQVWYSVPLAGYLLDAIGRPTTKFAAMGGVMALFLAQYIQGQFRKPQPQMVATGA